MKQKLSLQITEIQNGFIVGIPPTADELRAAAVSGRQPQGEAIHCEGFTEVTDTLRKLWPSEISQLA